MIERHFTGPSREGTSAHVPTHEITMSDLYTTEKAQSFENSSAFIEFAGEKLVLNKDTIERIQTLLTAQKKIDSHWGQFEGGWDKIEEEYLEINCRRAALYVGGQLTLDQTISSQDGADDRAIVSEQINHEVEVNPDSYITDQEELLDYLDNVVEFPAYLHMTDLMKGTALPDHTVIMLGRLPSGKIVCAEKAGPYIDNRFALVDIEKVLRPYASRMTYTYTVVPASNL